MDKIKIAILFGGMSAEHAISLRSAAAIYQFLDRSRFTAKLVYINREGLWTVTSNDSFIEESYQKESFHPFLPWSEAHQAILTVDIVFPVLHGPNGEDGRIQGLLEVAQMPFVGAGSIGSMLAMDKVIAKILFLQAGLRTPDFLFFEQNNMEHIGAQVADKLTYPVFVKPASLGSSVGISKVASQLQLKDAVDLAFSYDRKILIEKGIDKREIEVSVMGNEEIVVSKPGELIPFHEFYDYEDKYLLGKTEFKIPVSLDLETEKEIMRVAQKAYRALFLNGMARVDLFLENGTNAIYVNELNTIPGFTEISMFPKLWQAQGIGFSELISRLIDYGFAYHRGQKQRVDENIGH